MSSAFAGDMGITGSGCAARGYDRRMRKYTTLSVSRAAYEKLAARAKKEKRTIVAVVEMLIGL